MEGSITALMLVCTSRTTHCRVSDSQAIQSSGTKNLWTVWSDNTLLAAMYLCMQLHVCKKRDNDQSVHKSML